MERKEIFEVHVSSLKLAKDIDLDQLSAQTPGFSGADIANICNEAALIAARHEKQEIEKSDFANAIDRIIGGLEKKSKILSAPEKTRVAYHEAGHAVVSWMLKHADTLLKVSIVPRGKSLGAAWYLPEEHQLITESEFQDKLCAALGGRAAEEVTFGEISSGGLDDLEKVTKQAYTMVAFYGLNEKIGNVSFYDSTGEQERMLQKPYSEATAELIDSEVRELLNDAYQRTKQILYENQTGLNALAKRLLEKEVVYREDLEEILGKRGIEHRHQAITGYDENPRKGRSKGNGIAIIVSVSVPSFTISSSALLMFLIPSNNASGLKRNAINSEFYQELSKFRIIAGRLPAKSNSSVGFLG